jgi:hypothetical protein
MKENDNNWRITSDAIIIVFSILICRHNLFGIQIITFQGKLTTCGSNLSMMSEVGNTSGHKIASNPFMRRPKAKALALLCARPFMAQGERKPKVGLSLAVAQLLTHEQRPVYRPTRRGAGLARYKTDHIRVNPN